MKPFAVVCASHTPMLLEADFATPEICARVSDSFTKMASFVQAFQPDHIIQFSPDHYHGFHYDNMPSFCIGAAAKSYGDWNTGVGTLSVDEDFAMSAVEHVMQSDIDVAFSYDMTVDHGFVQMWETMFGTFGQLSLVPVFINCIAWPLPAYRRARLLGEAMGRYAASSGKRILFAASGGLSHDPVIPQIKGASAEVRQRLLGATPPSADQQARREQQVRLAATDAMQGRGPARPLNPIWDRDFLDLLAKREWDRTDSFDARSVDAVAGAGGNEVLCWVAAAAAMAAANGGAYDVVQSDYVPVDGWIAGMAHFAARSA